MTKQILNATYCFLGAVLICFVCTFNNPVAAQEVEVEINTGPEFTPSDSGTISGCIANTFTRKFPLDFVAVPPDVSGETTCPKLEIFNNEYEACWIIDIYLNIEPAILISLFWIAIVNL